MIIDGKKLSIEFIKEVKEEVETLKKKRKINWTFSNFNRRIST